MCTVHFESAEIRTPPYTGQLTVVKVVSLLQRSHCKRGLIYIYTSEDHTKTKFNIAYGSQILYYPYLVGSINQNSLIQCLG